MTRPRSPGGALHTVLLDIDGSLIDSNDARARAWVAALFVTEELPTLRPTPGARALLVHMRARGLELVVATSANATS